MTMALLLDVLVKGTVLLVVTVAIAFAFRRASASLRHLIWSMSVVGLLLLPLLSVVMPNWTVPGLENLARVRGREVPAPQTAPAAPQVSQNRHVSRSPSPTPSTDAHRSTRGVTVGPVEPQMSDRAPRPEPASFVGRAAGRTAASQVNWGSLVATMWIVGASVVLATIVLGILQTWWLTYSAEEVRDGPLADMAEDAADQLAVRQRVTLLMSARSVMPMTWGLSPKVFLPSSANDWTDARIRAVLLHELAHVKRRDYLTQLIARFASALYWFNPLVWFALRQMRIERELACDDLVLNSGSKASEYAEHLLEIARSLVDGSGVPASSIAIARRNRFSERLLAILDATRRRADVSPVVAASAWVVGLLIVLPVASATVGSRVPASPLLRAPEILAVLPSPQPPMIAASPRVVQFELPEFRWTSTWAESDMATLPALDGVFGETLAELGLSNAWVSRPTVAAEVWADVIGGRGESSFDAALCDWTEKEGKRSTSMSIDDDDMRIRIRRGDCRLDIDAAGDIEFNTDETDVVEISRAGYFEIEERNGRERRRLELRPTREGSLERRWRVNGDERSYDAEGREWFGSLVPVIFRLTGIQAEERAARILERQGVDGLLQEIALIASDHVARRYYEVLLNQGDLDPTTMQRVVRQAAQDISSDFELAQLLIAVARDHPADEGVRIAYVEAATSISSDFEHRRVLSAILDRPALSQEVANAMLVSATDISSDFELASLLIQIAESHPIDDVLLPAFFDAANTISSDFEHRRVLRAALTAGAPSQLVLDRALESGTHIGSDHELANLLREVAELYPVGQRLPQSYVTTARTIDSDFELGRVLKGLVRRDSVTASTLAAVLDLAAPSISSDHEMAELLFTVLSKHQLDATTRPAFFRAVGTLASDFEQSRVLTKVVNEQPLDDTSVGELLESSLGIASDFEMANLLVKLAKRYAIGDELRPAFMKAADNISSTYERGRVLSALMPRAN